MKILITLALTLSLSLTLQTYGQSSEVEAAESSLNLNYGYDLNDDLSQSIIRSLVGDDTALSEIYAEQDNDPMEAGNEAPELLPESKTLQGEKKIRPKCGLPPSVSYESLDWVGADLVDNCSLEATFDF